MQTSALLRDRRIVIDRDGPIIDEDETEGDRVCEHQFFFFISVQRDRRIQVTLGPITDTSDVRFRNDPLVYAAGAQIARLISNRAQSRSPQSKHAITYCDLYCVDTRPRPRRHNLENFLPSWESTEFNVVGLPRDLKWRMPTKEDLGKEVIPTPFKRITEFIPDDETKIRGPYRIICKPGYKAIKKNLSWFKMRIPDRGPMRESCECQIDDQVEALRVPNVIRPSEREWSDTPIATRFGSVVLWFSATIRHVPIGHARNGPSSGLRYPMVNDLQLFFTKGPEITRFGRGTIFEWFEVRPRDRFTACASNPHRYDINFDLYLVQIKS